MEEILTHLHRSGVKYETGAIVIGLLIPFAQQTSALGAAKCRLSFVFPIVRELLLSGSSQTVEKSFAQSRRNQITGTDHRSSALSIWYHMMCVPERTG